MTTKKKKAFTSESILAFPRTLFTEEQNTTYRQAARAWINDNLVPHVKTWEQQGYVDKHHYYDAAKAGYYLSQDIATEYGGGGCTDYRYNVVLSEELIAAGCQDCMFGLGTDVVLPYFNHYCTEEQKAVWMPKLVKGAIAAIAMSEPHAGSDLQSIATTAVKDGSDYIINGNKMWISHGFIADLVIIICKTDPTAGYAGISLIVVPTDTPGFTCIKRVQKIGGHGADTCALRLKNVRVPQTNIIGQEGGGFLCLMAQLAQERLSIATGSAAAARRVLAATVNYCHYRRAFSKKVGNFQAVAHRLAELKTEVQMVTLFVDTCVQQAVDGTLTAETASMAKYYATEHSQRVAHECLQFFGGYGYLSSNVAAQAFVGNRVSMIYGGANEVMKEIIARHLGFTPSKL